MEDDRWNKSSVIWRNEPNLCNGKKEREMNNGRVMEWETVINERV